MQAIVDDTITDNVTSLMGVPSWMLVLLNNVLETTGKENILEVWPSLEVYFHGGVSFAPYRDQYSALLPKDNFRYYEVYNASEDRKSTRLNSSHVAISYAVFCLN